MENLLHRVADHADIDTRRAMGVPPRRLDPEWKDFVPRPYGNEVFKYFVHNKTLLYYEFWNYDQFYSEITRAIIPIDPEMHEWRHLPGSKVYGVHHNETTTERYKCDKVGIHFNTVMTAGWPVFIAKPRFV